MILKTKNGLRIDIGRIDAIFDQHVAINGVTVRIAKKDVERVSQAFDWHHQEQIYDDDMSLVPAKKIRGEIKDAENSKSRKVDK